MKHFTKQLVCSTISVVVSLLCVNASADVSNTGKVLKGDPDFIPSQFTIKNQSVLFLEEHVVNEDINGTGQVKFTIFNPSFEEVGSFTTPLSTETTATYTKYEGVYGPSNVQEAYRNSYPEQEGVIVDNFINIAQSRGYNKRIDQGDEIWMLPANEWDYLEYNYFGEKYPTSILVYKDGTISQINIQYTCDYGYIGYNKEGYEITDSRYATPESIELVSPNGYDTNSFKISQTLFNEDEACEWIIPTYSTVEVSDSTEYEKIEGKKIVTSGFKVISQNGSTISDVVLPAECNGEFVDFSLYTTDAGTFLLIASDYEYYMVYKVEKSSSSIKAIGAPRKVSVSPTAPRQGTPVNVNLGEIAGNDTKVSVVSVAGRTELVQTIKPGSTETVIDTDRLERGVYVVVVDNGISKRETTKIVVR